MINRTLLFSNPVYLSTANNQMLISYPGHKEGRKTHAGSRLKDISPPKTQKSVPIEDIGIVMLEHPQITITNKLLEKLTAHNVALVNCDQAHLPIAMLAPFAGHSEYRQRLHKQIELGKPLKKQLWQQTVIAKIRNQAGVLEYFGLNAAKLHHLAKNVKSGDTDNCEAQAASYYWPMLMQGLPGFYRHREGPEPNNLLNYGYAVLRALTARALISSGLLPALGIFHQNKYNPYCLADDIMEPYRPYLDIIVVKIMEKSKSDPELNSKTKQALLQVVAIDTFMERKKSPLMIAMSRSTHSLYECFAGIRRKILYPEIV